MNAALVKPPPPGDFAYISALSAGWHPQSHSLIRQTRWPSIGSLSLALLLGLSDGIASGAPFRLSFIDEKPVLEDTCQLLRQHGVPEDATRTFGRLVERHNHNGNRVDRVRFPAPQSGYYQFLSTADLTTRLSSCFHETPGDRSLDQNTLMCFDVACLLVRSAGCGAPLFYKDFESKGIVLVSRGGVTRPVGYEEFVSSNHLLYPPAGYEYFLGRPRSQDETHLGLALRAARRVSSNYADNDSGVQAAFADYVKAVERDGFAFPQDFKLGLALYVNLKSQYIRGDHSFICIPNNHRLVCLEKNGSKGPYVRVEFESEADLGQYMGRDLLRAASNPEDDDYGSAVVVSLNERLIQIYRPDTPTETNAPVIPSPPPPVEGSINQETKADWGVLLHQGRYRVINNVWNKGIASGVFQQKVFLEILDGKEAFGWQWSWPQAGV